MGHPNARAWRSRLRGYGRLSAVAATRCGVNRAPGRSAKRRKVRVEQVVLEKPARPACVRVSRRGCRVTASPHRRRPWPDRRRLVPPAHRRSLPCSRGWRWAAVADTAAATRAGVWGATTDVAAGRRAVAARSSRQPVVPAGPSARRPCVAQPPPADGAQPDTSWLVGRRVAEAPQPRGVVGVATTRPKNGAAGPTALPLEGLERLGVAAAAHGAVPHQTCIRVGVGRSARPVVLGCGPSPHQARGLDTGAAATTRSPVADPAPQPSATRAPPVALPHRPTAAVAGATTASSATVTAWAGRMDESSAVPLPGRPWPLLAAGLLILATAARRAARPAPLEWGGRPTCQGQHLAYRHVGTSPAPTAEGRAVQLAACQHLTVGPSWRQP